MPVIQEIGKTADVMEQFHGTETAIVTAQSIRNVHQTQTPSEVRDHERSGDT